MLPHYSCYFAGLSYISTEAIKKKTQFGVVSLFFISGQLPKQKMLFIHKQTTFDTKYEQTTPVYIITCCRFHLRSAVLSFCLFCLLQLPLYVCGSSPHTLYISPILPLVCIGIAAEFKPVSFITVSMHYL